MEIPKSLFGKLSSRNQIWFKGQGYSVKDMVDYLAEINMSDFSLEKSDCLFIQGYDNGYKPRGRMRISESEFEYLLSRMSDTEKVKRLRNRFLELTK